MSRVPSSRPDTRPRLARRLAACLALGASLAGCQSAESAPARPRGAVSVPDAVPSLPTLSRLTRSQYAHAIRDLFGGDVVAPSALEPDAVIDGSISVGATQSALSRRGV